MSGFQIPTVCLIHLCGCSVQPLMYNLFVLALKCFTLVKFQNMGSEYRTSLVFEWSKVVQSPNDLVFKCHLNTEPNLVWYSDHHLNTGHQNTGQVKVGYSDPHCNKSCIRNFGVFHPIKLPLATFSRFLHRISVSQSAFYLWSVLCWGGTIQWGWVFVKNRFVSFRGHNFCSLIVLEPWTLNDATMCRLTKFQD